MCVQTRTRPARHLRASLLRRGTPLGLPDHADDDRTENETLFFTFSVGELKRDVRPSRLSIAPISRCHGVCSHSSRGRDMGPARMTVLAD